MGGLNPKGCGSAKEKASPARGRGLEKPGGGSGERQKFGLELVLGDVRADDLVFHFAVFEKQQERDGFDVVFHREVAGFIDIDLADLRLAFDLAGELVENGADHFAGSAPFGPEINEDRLV